jgi:regulator of cell morphogenesis and NO signaling
MPVHSVLLATDRVGWPAEAANDEAPHDMASLVDHIVERFHRTHLRELPLAIRLSREVESRYAHEPTCPIGLADHLIALARDLEAHQWREEMTLFPLIRIGTPNCLNFVTRRMMDDHVDMDGRLMALKRFTDNYRPSFEAPFCWQALSFTCRKLEADLREHARLEHEVLYRLMTA